MNVQKQIKENAISTQAYFDDLNKWVGNFSGAPSAPRVPSDEEEDGFVKITDHTKSSPADSQQQVQRTQPMQPTQPPRAPTQGSAPANQPVRVVRSELRVSDVTMATRKKDEGNAAFKQGRLKEALSLYELALSYVKPSQFREAPESANLRSVILANRALVHLKLSDYAAAVSDCTAALETDASNCKATFRRAQAYTKLAKYEEALVDLLACKEAVGAEAETEMKRVQIALEFQKEKQRSIARKIVTDPLRKINKPLRPLVISDSKNRNPVDTEFTEPSPRLPAAAYVPKSVRMAGGSATRPTAQINTYAEFEKLWRNKSGRMQVLHLLEPARLGEIFKESLDFEVFSEILECLLAASSEVPQAAGLLRGLSSVKRFGLIVGLLSHGEKQKLTEFVEHLRDEQSRTAISSLYGL